MRRMSMRGRTLGVVAATIGLSWFGVLAERSAQAEPVGYSTTGHVWPWTAGNGAASGIDGQNVITFQGIVHGSTDLAAPFSLGEFQISALPEGQTTTYHNTAFTITLDTTLGGNAVVSRPGDHPYSSLAINGELNGIVHGGGGGYNVVAEILSIQPDPPMSVPEHALNPILDLPFPAGSLSVDPPPAIAPALIVGTIPVTALVSAVPEPASITLLLTALGGLGLRRGLFGRRRA